MAGRRKHGVIAIVIAGGCDEELFPLCKQRRRANWSQSLEGADDEDGGGGGLGGMDAQGISVLSGEHKADDVQGGGSSLRSTSGMTPRLSNEGEAEEALVPLGNAPLLHYPLSRLEELFTPATGGMANVAVAVPGDDGAAARIVKHWIDRRYALQVSLDRGRAAAFRPRAPTPASRLRTR